MARVERREPALAANAVAVLREQGVEALVADAAGGVDGLRTGVGADDAEALAEAACGFELSAL